MVGRNNYWSVYSSQYIMVSKYIIWSKLKFEKANSLFIKKWHAKKQKTFIEYMNEMWLSTHQNWYEGIAEYTPSQNNG